MIETLSDVFILRNGIGIPCIAFGTFGLAPGKTTVRAVEQALNIGIRFVDTAMIYRNEADVAAGMEAANIERSQLFLSSKLWVTDYGYDAALRAFDRSLEALKTDYLDLFLVHWPATRTEDSDEWKKTNAGTWKALEKLYEDGRVRAIGVANFKPPYIDALDANIAPMINQIEFHPGQLQPQILEYCRSHEIQVVAWGTFGSGALLQNRLLDNIASMYGKTSAQLIVRWCLQHQVVPIIHSVRRENLVKDTRVFNFAISPEDMHRIDIMPYMGGSGLDPDTTTF